jgi:hypothetical protein
MANEIKELREQIALSIFLCPCTEKELGQRDFLKNTSYYGIGMQLQKLDCLDATFYKGDVIHIKKEWAKKNLKGYDLDFRTEKQKQIDSMTPFAKAVLGYN